MGRLHRLSLLSILIGPALAQISFPNCSTGWEWSYNSLNQNPCNVAAYLEASCNGGQFNIQPLPSGRMYAPNTTEGASCECNTVVYSLVSACAACQGSTWVLWSGWSVNCSNVWPSTYPNPIPGGTRVPHWAYLDVVVSDSWNITAAQSAGDSPEVTPTVSTIQMSATPSATLKSISNPSSNQNSSHAGEIAGAVVGCIAGAALLATFVLWYLRRRRRRAGARPSPYAHRPQAFDPQDNGTNMPVGRYYDPSDPSTFPPSFLSPSTTAIHTTASTEGIHSGESIRPHDRSQYPGLPLV